MGTIKIEACKVAKDGNTTLKQSVPHMANKFLNVVKLLGKEACIDILQMPITQL